MRHAHDVDEKLKESGLTISFLLNITTSIVQIIGGLFSGSLSLISDALHNLSCPKREIPKLKPLGIKEPKYWLPFLMLAC